MKWQTNKNFLLACHELSKPDHMVHQLINLA